MGERVASANRRRNLWEAALNGCDPSSYIER
jgi:hypothetical protein